MLKASQQRKTVLVFFLFQGILAQRCSTFQPWFDTGSRRVGCWVVVIKLPARRWLWAPTCLPQLGPPSVRLGDWLPPAAVTRGVKAGW